MPLSFDKYPYLNDDNGRVFKFNESSLKLQKVNTQQIRPSFIDHNTQFTIFAKETKLYFGKMN